ncbi:5-oxoprolinase subunit PxpA [Alteromonas sp. 5E99-2]|uniref:5-oxoprolinase subunit PxpA n=1 Tax=Alteromonas sp. 5E99-2 TaxID=2817683 RepID=UPI00325B62A3
MQQIALNSDLGEGYSVYTLTDERIIIPLIDQANIACGFHGGDPTTLMDSLSLCAQHNVSVGAHPSYPDRQGFGRRSMAMSAEELEACILYQVSALVGLAKIHGIAVSYIKPHGALYNDMMKDEAIFNTVLQAVSKLPNSLDLMILATPNYKDFQEKAEKLGIKLRFEAFADRRYTEEGALTARSQSDAVLSETDAIAQAKNFISGGSPFPVDSICVHGDSPSAIAMVKSIRALIPNEK